MINVYNEAHSNHSIYFCQLKAVEKCLVVEGSSVLWLEAAVFRCLAWLGGSQCQGGMLYLLIHLLLHLMSYLLLHLLLHLLIRLLYYPLSVLPLQHLLIHLLPFVFPSPRRLIFIFIKPARSACARRAAARSFSQIKKIPYQAPPTQLGPRKCTF